MDQGKCDLTLELLWKLHIWSQSVYPGEFEALFGSKGQDFHEIETIFENSRGDVLNLLAHKICGDEKNCEKISVRIEETLRPVEKSLREKTVGFDNSYIYLGYIEMTLSLIRAIALMPLDSSPIDHGLE